MYFSIDIDGQNYSPDIVKTEQAEAYFFPEEKLKAMCLILCHNLYQFFQSITISLNFEGQTSQNILQIPLLKIYWNQSQCLSFVNIPDYDKSEKILSEHSIDLCEIAKEIEPILNYIQEILQNITNGVSHYDN